MTRLTIPAVLALLLLGAAPVLAQPANVVRVRGTIEKLDGNELSVKSREGPSVKIKLADNYAVNAVVPYKLAEVGKGQFIGTAAMKQPDGSFRALEVLVFPEAMRGTGEGHYPWDLQPESTMTNASIAALVEGSNGRELTLEPKGGSPVKVVVPPGTPVVTFMPGDKSLLTPGAHIFAGTTKAADGTLGAARVNVGKDGLVPPM